MIFKQLLKGVTAVLFVALLIGGISTAWWGREAHAAEPRAGKAGLKSRDGGAHADGGDQAAGVKLLRESAYMKGSKSFGAEGLGGTSVNNALGGLRGVPAADGGSSTSSLDAGK